MRGLSIASVSGAIICAFLPGFAQAQSPDLPDGAGMELVASVCTGCHGTNQITRSSGYTLEGWKELIGTMIDLSASPQEQETIIAYLAAQFPPNTRRAPVLMPGEASVSFKEWQVPTLGQRSRDPVEAVDGSIWWAGQWGNLIGRIDPASVAMQEYALPGGSMPHSVTSDAAGNIWYTGNKNGTIGKLDPATGEIKLVTMRTPGARPYGIKIDADGVPWVACNGSNCLVKVDPATMELTEIKLPIAETTVRRFDIAADGMIWYVNSSQGRLGRFDPKSGDIKEWPSPSGPKSHPYALAVVDGAVWYNESGKRPDALIRFDPKTESFQSWPIPSATSMPASSGTCGRRATAIC